MNYRKNTFAVTLWNWRYMRILLLCLAFWGWENPTAQATHFSAGNISYECLGNNQYRIKLVLYRDCDGVSMAAAESVNLSSASCGSSVSNVTLTRDTFYELHVPQFCITNIGQSSCNGGNFPGYEVHEYCGIVTLPQVCSDWIVSWSGCCRNNAITTLTNQGTMYLEAMINNTICNNSPVFRKNAGVQHIRAGFCYDYNHGAVDAEGDVILYELTCPMEGPSNCAPYAAGLSSTLPVFTSPANTFNLDPNTGQMSFCSQPALSQYSAMGITAYQIVNGDTLGYVRSEITMLIVHSANSHSPIIASTPTGVTGGTFNASTNTFNVCAGQSLSFEMMAYDPEGSPVIVDTILTNLDELVGAGNWSIQLDTMAPFRPDSVRAQVQINTSSDDIGLNIATLGFTDNYCVIIGVASLGYQLKVLGVDAYIDSLEELTITDCHTTRKSKTHYCPGVAIDIPLNTSAWGVGTGIYAWTQVSGPTVTFSNPLIANPIVTIPATAQSGDSVVLSVQYTSGACSSSDQVVIYFDGGPIQLIANASQTLLCPGQQDTIALSTTVLGYPGGFAGTYNWTATPASYISSLTDSTIGDPLAILSGNAGDSVTFEINVADGGCGSNTVSLGLKWRSGMAQASTTMDTICVGDTVQLNAELTDTTSQVNPLGCHIYSVDSMVYAPMGGTGTAVSLADDDVSNALPIGFDFEFYCNTYNQFYIGSNGFIAFDSSDAGCCVGQVLPNSSIPNNLIALAWGDLSPNNGGTIEYFTLGTAPNRQLVVNFTNVPRFSGPTNITVQVVLHEGTNYIDIHTTNVQIGGITTQGIENMNGTVGLAVPGRNGAAWGANNDAYRFSPANTPVWGPITYTWSPSGSLSNASIHNPLASPNSTTTYQVTISEGGCTSEDSVTIWVNGDTSAPVISCRALTTSTNSLLFEWGPIAGATSWEYSLDTGNTWTGLPLQDSSVLLTGLLQGTCYGIWVRPIFGNMTCATGVTSYFECCTNLLSPVVNKTGNTLTAEEVGAAITYQWVDCDNNNSPIGGAVNRSFTPTVDGNYAVVISDGTNTVTSACVNVILSSVTALAKALGVSYYPNPTTGDFFIEKKHAADLTIEVVDNIGRTLMQSTMTAQKLTLDLSPYPAGVYMVIIRNETTQVVEKVIKY